MKPAHHLAALVLGSSLLFAACGGDDATPALDPAPPATAASTNSSAATSGEGASATIAPDVPEEFLPAIGPVEVVGASLPFLETDDVASDPAVGTVAPILVGEAFDGSPVRVDPATAGPTLVVFLAHWCPHCNDEIPRINQLRDEGRFPAGLEIVGVATASNPGRPNFPPAEWLAEKDWTYPAMADGIDMVRETFIAAEAFGVSGFPFVTLVNGDGTVAARWSGERGADEFLALIEEHLDPT